MVWPLIRLNESSFRRLNITVIFFDFLCLLIAIGLIVEAINIKQNIGRYINLISSSDGNTFAMMMLIIVIIAIPTHLFGIIMNFYIHAGKISRHLITWLFYNVFAALSIAVCSFCIIIIMFLHVYHLQDSVQNGIVSSMKLYNKKGRHSEDIDLLQINFQCCGSISHREWFYLQWDEDMADADSSISEQFISDDVPYSCCSKLSMNPCVHNNIKSSSNVYRYNPKHSLTISKPGCHGVLIKYTRRLVGIISVFLLALIFFEAFLCIGKRIEQTGLSRARYINETCSNELVYKAWVIGSAPNRKPFRKEELEEEVLRTTSTETTTTSG